MKHLRILFISFIIFGSPLFIKAQLEKVIVETYYVSDTSDAIDVIGDSNRLPIGSKTYRIYLDLQAGSKLLKLYGSKGHPLKFFSTKNFYNYKDNRGKSTGDKIARNQLRTNTLALDSWLTLGQAAISLTGSPKKTCLGVLKSKDNDGLNLLKPHSPLSMLTNNDTSAGIAISIADGYVDALVGPTPVITSSGIVDNLSGNDSTIFGSVVSRNSFNSTEVFLKTDSGAVGSDTSNIVLVAQLTTLGDLNFELNIDIKLSNGTTKSYVSSETIPVTGDTIVSPSLKYPAACGCQDVNFLEYSNTFSCSLPSACKTPIVLGCMDKLACNYNPLANLNVTDLCCYVGKCNDRDIAVVCPALDNEKRLNKKIIVYPNKADKNVTISNLDESTQSMIEIYNNFGIKLMEYKTELNQKEVQLDISHLNGGIYVLKYLNSSDVQSILIIKN
jgi:hypothetical protein